MYGIITYQSPSSSFRRSAFRSSKPATRHKPHFQTHAVTHKSGVIAAVKIVQFGYEERIIPSLHDRETLKLRCNYTNDLLTRKKSVFRCNAVTGEAGFFNLSVKMPPRTSLRSSPETASDDEFF